MDMVLASTVTVVQRSWNVIVPGAAGESDTT